MYYWICEAKTVETLCNLVNGYIEKGWRPHGPMSVVQSRSTSDWWFYQPMILEDGEPADPRDPELA